MSPADIRHQVEAFNQWRVRAGLPPRVAFETWAQSKNFTVEERLAIEAELRRQAIWKAIERGPR